MNCVNLKLKLSRKLYCKKINKEINIKEYKPYKSSIKKKRYSLTKQESNRFSIIFHDLSKCCICGSKIAINKHEVFFGSYRHNSIKYGMVMPLCQNHHTGAVGIHNNRNIDLFYKRKFQTKFEETHTRDEFIKLFGKNYLK